MKSVVGVLCVAMAPVGWGVVSWSCSMAKSQNLSLVAVGGTGVVGDVGRPLVDAAARAKAARPGV